MQITRAGFTIAITQKVRSQMQTYEIRFFRRIEGVTLFIKVKVHSSEIRKFLNIEPYFSKFKNISLDGWAMWAECLRKDCSNKLYLPEQMGEDQLDDLELGGPITFRILSGIVWDFTQTKWWKWWKTVKCCGLISSCCPRNPHGKAGSCCTMPAGSRAQIMVRLFLVYTYIWQEDIAKISK